MGKILPGELFIVSYEDGTLVNRWAVNSGKIAIFTEPKHLVSNGEIDVLTEDLLGEVAFKENRSHIVEGAEQIVLLKEAGIREQSFGGQTLQVLKLENETTIHNTSGKQIGTLPAGTEIGIQDGDAGDGSKHLLAVNAYDSKDGKGWRFLNEATYSYGCLNIQEGFNLKLYNTKRAISTKYSQVQNKLDWSLIQRVQEGKQDEKEILLRDIPQAATFTEVRGVIRDYFAAIDLKTEILGDPEAYFMWDENAEFIISELIKAGKEQQATLFDDERLYFLNK